MVGEEEKPNSHTSPPHSVWVAHRAATVSLLSPLPVFLCFVCLLAHFWFFTGEEQTAHRLPFVSYLCYL